MVEVFLSFQLSEGWGLLERCGHWVVSQSGSWYPGPSPAWLFWLPGLLEANVLLHTLVLCLSSIQEVWQSHLQKKISETLIPNKSFIF